MNPRVLYGLAIGCVVGWLMRQADNLPAAINWTGTPVPYPAVIRVRFRHPKYGWIEGHRAKHCRNDREIVRLITDLWRTLPDVAMDPPVNQEDEA